MRSAGFHGKRRLFPVRKTELSLGIDEAHCHRSGMAVRDRLLVRAIVHFQNSYLTLFAHDRMLGVDFTQFGVDGSLFFNVINPKFVPGYSENYNLTIQRELPAHMVFSVGYVGAEGRHEQITIEQNPITGW
jgi:hypothetical protein